MPLYNLRCDACLSERETFRKIQSRDDLPLCSCGGVFQRLVAAPVVIRELKPYISPGSGKLIDSRSKMREDLLSTNSIMKEPGMERDAIRAAAATKARSFEPIAKSVDETVARLVSQRQIQS